MAAFAFQLDGCYDYLEKSLPTLGGCPKVEGLLRKSGFWPISLSQDYQNTQYIRRSK